MWLFRFLFCSALVWTTTTANQDIQKAFNLQDIKDVFYSHPRSMSKYNKYKSNKATNEESNDSEQLLAGKFGPTGWITKCRGLECISTVTGDNADHFLTKALDVLDKYTSLRGSKHNSAKNSTKKQNKAESPNSLAKLLATTSGVYDTEDDKEINTETKKSHGRLNIDKSGTRRQNWYNDEHGSPIHTIGSHGLYGNNAGGGVHSHGLYEPIVGIQHKPIHVMDPSYAPMDHSTTGNAAVAHFHQPLSYPVMNSPVIHHYPHFHRPYTLNPVMSSHHPIHIQANEPMLLHHQSHNLLLDGPVPPYPSMPWHAFQHSPLQHTGPHTIQHIPYPVPVPGPTKFHPVLVPFRVHPPLAIQNVPVPVRINSPPKIYHVPFPVPYPVQLPPKIQKVPYPVRIPIRQPPVIQRYFYPVGIPQPGQIHHVPYPIYIQQPPHIKPVPYPVHITSPPLKIRIPVPSPPKIVVQRVPYPVMVQPPSMIHEVHHIETEGSHCNVNPCDNGGTCTAFHDSYRCHCRDGFKGIHCKEQSKCRPNPCRNLGTCTEVEKDYECTCQPGYKGVNCDISDPCSPSPCKNGGTCAEVGSSFTCDCRVGWIGKGCEMEAKCLPINPCQNGGTCSEALGAYQCNCMPGWQGISCESSHPEISDPVGQPSLGGCNNCHPNAYCQEDECVCDAGYLGDGYICEVLAQIHDKRVVIKKLIGRQNHQSNTYKRHRVPKIRTAAKKKKTSAISTLVQKIPLPNGNPKLPHPKYKPKLKFQKHS